MMTSKASLHIDSKIPILYICFFKAIYDKYSKLKIRLYNTEITSIFRQYLTKNLAHNRNQAIIDDLVYYGLLKQVGRNLYELQCDKYLKVTKQTEEYWAWS